MYELDDVATVPAQHLWPLGFFSPQSGTLPWILYRTLRSVQTVSDVYLKHICLLVTSASSTLGFLTIIVLYKSTYLLTQIPLSKLCKNVSKTRVRICWSVEMSHLYLLSNR